MRQRLYLWTVILTLASTAHAKVLYVSTAGSDSNDGLSWATAKLTIKAGLSAAVADDQVWVARGVYVGCITLKAEVSLFGGFIGYETSLEERPSFPRSILDVNQTVLDGNKTDSVVTSPAAATSATRLDGFTIRNGYGDKGAGIYCSSSSPTICGNTITGNIASLLGGGISCSGPSSPIIINNKIFLNFGGGITCSGSSPLIANNIISENRVLRGTGGGLYCSYSSAVVCNNTIASNTADTGGGIYCSDSPLVISNNIIAMNSSGIYNNYGVPILRNNCIYNPEGANYSGLSAGIKDISLDPRFLAATFAEFHLKSDSPCINAGNDTAVKNDWEDMDGDSRITGLHVDIGADEFNAVSPPFMPKVIRVSPIGNDSNDGSCWELAKLTIQAGLDAAAPGDQVWVRKGTYAECILLKNHIALYGGFKGDEKTFNERNWEINTSIIDGHTSGSTVSSPPGAVATTRIDGFTIRNGIGTADGPDQRGGGICCIFCSSPSICNNKISDNIATFGGGIFCSNYSSPSIFNNKFTGNSASLYGGAVYCMYSSSPFIHNSFIIGNSAGSSGGGIYCGDSSSSPSIINNTLAVNSAGYRGGGIYFDGHSLTITNNVISHNSSGICGALASTAKIKKQLCVQPRR